MVFSLDIQSTRTLKAEAKALREERKAKGEELGQGAALEEIAHRHGYRDWNTARAALPDRIAPPVQVGDRVEGAYLGNSFTGSVLGVELMHDMQHVRVTVLFDDPVNVSKSQLFSAFRSRVVATLDSRGVSPAVTGDGQPQMRLRRA